MSSMKQRLLGLLEDKFEIDEHQIAGNLAIVIKGETVTNEYDGKGNLTKTKRTIRPEDAMYGAMVYDAMVDGDLGLAPKQMITGKAALRQRTHKRMGADDSILVNGVIEASFEPTDE